ncbi:hypothetical protein BC830DRAFT_1131527 [Chytriomyces sp. MP71]|nr:hypothetical protein BC830DRAFT_1131527 [Chytriomyces sp. MP71]
MIVALYLLVSTCNSILLELCEKNIIWLEMFTSPVPYSGGHCIESHPDMNPTQQNVERLEDLPDMEGVPGFEYRQHIVSWTPNFAFKSCRE